MTALIAGVRSARKFSPRRLVGVALAVSVALNLCFVAGALWSRLTPPQSPVTASERFHRLAETLDLTADQRVAYDAYVAGMLARSQHLRKGVEPVLDAAWIEIGKPRPDEARVRQLFEEASAWRRAFQEDALAATLSLLNGFTPTQRAKFIASENERHAAARERRLNNAR
ncbi:MAG TPA: periplasmic heavy metal sensor [Stellaceae bacterium]|nr:periplasmic heavy metal sensor [Stellaceae bacterium]